MRLKADLACRSQHLPDWRMQYILEHAGKYLSAYFWNMLENVARRSRDK